MRGSCGLFLVMVWTAGCAHVGGGSGGGESRDLQRYMPLSVGNKWIYATTFQGQSQADLTVAISKQEGPYFLDNRPHPSRYAFDGEGLRDGTQRYMLKAPLLEGSKWMSVADVKTVEHYEIIAVNREVSVPAGVFKGCVTVRMEVRMTETRSMRNEVVYSPDVGIVEVRTLLKDGAKVIPQSHLVLKSFELKSSRKEG